jgi:hypothetical protein
MNTFRVKINNCSVNTEIEEYINDYIVSEYYLEESETLTLDYIEGIEVEIKPSVVWEKDHYRVEHEPTLLIVNAKFTVYTIDSEEYDDTDVYVPFKDLQTNYVFETITDHWNDISISENGIIEVN